MNITKAVCHRQYTIGIVYQSPKLKFVMVFLKIEIYLINIYLKNDIVY